jgi:hypothetical protein
MENKIFMHARRSGKSRSRELYQAANFLASLDGLTQHEAYENARLDAKLYRWSDATLTAVIEGIGKAKLPIK